MRKSLAASAALSVFLLAGCGGTISYTPASPPPAPTASVSSMDLEVLSLAHTNGGTRSYELSDEIILKTAHSVCTSLDAGLGAQGVITQIDAAADGDPGVQKVLTAVTAAGIHVYCPQYVPLFTSGT